MKYRLKLAFVIGLAIGGLGLQMSVAAGAASPGLSCPAQAADARPRLETTIRNVTDRPISYRIYPSAKPGAAKTHEIAPNAIDRYKTAGILIVEFETGDKEAVYSLDPGKPYSFRRDTDERIDLFEGSHGRADAADLAPWVPTPNAVLDKMLELAGVGGKDVLYDIGCGDGRIVIAAARKYGARGVGIDLDKTMIEESVASAKAAGVEGLVKFICMDATKADVSAATVVTLYLLPESNALLRPILERQLKPGVRVVTHNYTIPGWEAKQTKTITVQDEGGKDHTVYLYIR